MKKNIIKAMVIISAAAMLAGCTNKTTASMSQEAAETTAEVTKTEATEETKAENDTDNKTEAKTENQTEGMPSESETEKGEPVGMVNPMEEVSDSGEFDEQLGIHINAQLIDEDAKTFIINKKLAHVVWTQENVNREECELTLRATKDEETAPMMHGIYDSNMTDEYENDITIADDKTIKLHFQRAATENCGIYTWKDGKIFYSLTYNKDMSQMSLAEILDRIMLATGIVYHKDILKPLAHTDILKDGIFPASFEKDWIYDVDDMYLMECDLYQEELFDAVEVSLMQEGDKIILEGDMVVEIDSIERLESGEISINGNFDGDGFYLRPCDGGTYKVRGLDDMCSYSFVGSGKYRIAEDVELIDTSDIENGCKEVKVKGADEVVDYIRNTEHLHISLYSTKLRIEDNIVKAFEIRYTP